MRVRVDSALSFDASTASPRLIERLRALLSFPNPAYLERLRLGLRGGAEPETLCFLDDEGDRIRIPRGAIHTLRSAAAHEGEIIACEDARTLPDERLGKMPDLCLRSYQRAAVDALERVRQGVVVIPCGGGKTRVGMGAISRLEMQTLILVHTLDLADQWMSELREQLGIDAGLVGDGVARVAPVTVAVIQTLVRWERSDLDAFLARFGLVIVDEAHHVAASTFHAIVDRAPARYRLGLTATPEREDGLSQLLGLFLGETLCAVTHEELVAAGVLAVPEIRSVPTSFTHPYNGPDDYAPMLAAIASDAERNRLIVANVVSEARAGHTCLVLSGRIDHCEALAHAVEAAGVSVAVLTGSVKRGARRDALERARAGKLSVVIATSLADEGLDLPRLSRVFLAFPGRARGRTMQRLGRLMRPHPEKRDAALFDFVDSRVPLLRRHHQERRRLYAEVLGLPASRLRPEVTAARARG